MLGFLNRLTRRRPQAGFDAPVAPGARIYAIGDVHGSASLLDALLDRIAVECAAEGAEAEVVLLGDYIDRGDDTRATLDILGGLDERRGIRPVLLKGNHEEMLLDVLDAGASPAGWLRHGGLQTLLSYRVAAPAALGQRDPSAEAEMRAALAEAMGPHLDLLRGLGLSHRAGNVFFAHAGADPAIPVELQTEQSLVWGAPAFLEEPRRDGLWIVHGHYVVEEPVVAAGRIGVDTGAYFSQRLTAVRLEDGRASFLAASAEG